VSSPIKTFVKKTKQFVLESTYRKPCNIELKKPIFSFTFDDVPPSAVTNGGDILTQHRCHGTYYVASGITEQRTSYLSDDELVHLVDNGHEVACHTFHHKSLRWLGAEDTKLECNKNTTAINAVLPDYKVSNFSYPFGEAGIGSKKALRNIYDCMRTSDAGLNYGMTDLSHLRAISLYSKDFNKIKLLEVIQQTIKHNAWTIFYTHDVSEQFGPWGTSIEDFRWIVEQCSKKDAEILSIKEAIDKINI
jgi:peptidoglycan/xylan/chitin deacetylase (PgdA/CDA1 family)